MGGPLPEPFQPPSESVVHLLSSSKEKTHDCHESTLMTVPVPRRISWVQSEMSGSEFPQTLVGLGCRSFGSICCRDGLKLGSMDLEQNFPEVESTGGLGSVQC